MWLFENCEIKPIIPSLSHSQDIIIAGIIDLYIPGKVIDMDPTYNTGGFYKSGKIRQPHFKFDIAPRLPEVRESDCRKLPLENSSVRSIIFDPPFLGYSKGAYVEARYTTFANYKELFLMYKESLAEFYRLLDMKGILIFKCQDTTEGNRVKFLHIDAVYKPALEIGFRAVDLFILASKWRPISINQAQNQKHARKFHCYFWVFEKREWL